MSVTELCKDKEGAIWIATDQGLSRFKDDRFTNYTVKDGLASNTVRGLYCDPEEPFGSAPTRAGCISSRMGRSQQS